jgi:hypothetical protein
VIDLLQFLNIPRLKFSNKHVHELEFFWGTHIKTKVGVNIKITLYATTTNFPSHNLIIKIMQKLFS